MGTLKFIALILTIVYLTYDYSFLIFYPLNMRTLRPLISFSKIADSASLVKFKSFKNNITFYLPRDWVDIKITDTYGIDKDLARFLITRLGDDLYLEDVELRCIFEKNKGQEGKSCKELRSLKGALA